MNEYDENGTSDIVPIRRGDSQVRFAVDVQELAFGLWLLYAGRDAAQTERLLAQELPGEPIPTAQTIRNWARAQDWPARADDHWRTHGARTVYELQEQASANFRLSQRIKGMAMSGGFAGREQEGALALKAAELSDRLLERSVVPIVPVPPADSGIDLSGMSTEEKEAYARKIRLERKGKNDGG